MKSLPSLPITPPRGFVSTTCFQVARRGGVLAAIALAAWCAPHAAGAAERYTLRGDRVAIYNLAGDVTLAPSKGDQVVVEVTLEGPDADRVRVETGTHGDREALRVVFPGDRIVYPKLGRGSNTSFRVREDGTFGDNSSRARGRRVTIVGSGNGTEAHATVRILVPPGRDVQVRLGAGELAVNDVEAELDLDTAMGAVACHGTRGRLAIDTGSGSVRVSEAQGDLDLDTGSGSVVVADARGDDLRIDTGSGSVRVERARSERLVVDTGSGDVTLSGVDAPSVRVDTGSGSVQLAAGSRLHSCHIDTGSGSVTVAVTEDLDAAFRIETGSGGIDVDLPHSVTRRGRGYVHGRLGNGDGSLEIDTGSGSVRVKRAG